MFLMLNQTGIVHSCQKTKPSSDCMLEVASEFDYEHFWWKGDNNKLLSSLNWAVGYPRLDGK